MNVFRLTMAITFWTCGALVTYAYAIYPALISWLPKWFGRSSAPPDDSDANPEITLLIAAYNEGA